MATSSVIKVMISSRCGDRFPLGGADSRSMSAIRADLKLSIEAARPLGQALYEVWINEDHVGDGSKPAWDHCMDQARDCDILIAIYNGNAGWEDAAGTVGICHAEFEKAYSSAPGKVFVVNAFESGNPAAASRTIDKRFQGYVTGLKQFDARNITSEEALIAAFKRTLNQATVQLVQRGVQVAGLGSNHVGPPLAWSRQSYTLRADNMRRSILGALEEGTLGKAVGKDGVGCEMAGKQILFVAAAIPDALSVATAREEVGQPHLHDHELKGRLKTFHGGPVHVIACHKGATEAQARAMLGFPDATVIAAPFGVYVADPVQSIQIVLIARCRDDTSTRIGVQRFREWLDAADQASELVRLAAKRKSVIKVLADS